MIAAAADDERVCSKVGRPGGEDECVEDEGDIEIVGRGGEGEEFWLCVDRDGFAGMTPNVLARIGRGLTGRGGGVFEIWLRRGGGGGGEDSGCARECGVSAGCVFASVGVTSVTSTSIVRAAIVSDGSEAAAAAAAALAVSKLTSTFSTLKCRPDTDGVDADLADLGDDARLTGSS